jgi:hypothetical protein
MKGEDLPDRTHAAPFRQFTICMADGQRMPVVHPEFMAYPRGARNAVAFDRDQRIHYIDVMLITVMRPGWRLLGPLEAASGFLMFRLSASAMFAVSNRLLELRLKRQGPGPPS